MPAGDAGLDRQTCEVCREIDRLQVQLAAQQAVVTAQRNALADIAGAASNRTPKTAMRYMARTAREALDKAQVAQPEGER